MSRWRSVLPFGIPLLAALAAIAFFSDRRSGDFRIDEPHKIAETYYLRLVEQRNFTHRDWFIDRVERSNPVAGKYLFGIAIQLAGLELPRDLSAALETNNGQRHPPAAVERDFRNDLLPVRTVSLIATAITAAFVALVALRASGAFASLIAAFFFLSNFLTQAFAGTAVFDPILTLFAFATLALIDAISFTDDNRRRDLAFSVVAGLLGAIAYQIRMSGAFAMVVFCAAILVRSILAKRIRRGLAICAIAGSIALIAGTAMNPFYWAVPSEPAVARQFSGDEPLPLRIVSRYEQQLSDLGSLLERERRTQHPLSTIGEKGNFVFQYACGDLAGLTTLLGCLLAILLLRDVEHAARVTLAWCIGLIAVFTIWIPIGYPRFVLLIVPPLALAGAIGWATLAGGLVKLVKERAKK